VTAALARNTTIHLELEDLGCFLDEHTVHVYSKAVNDGLTPNFSQNLFGFSEICLLKLWISCFTTCIEERSKAVTRKNRAYEIMRPCAAPLHYKRCRPTVAWGIASSEQCIHIIILECFICSIQCLWITRVLVWTSVNGYNYKWLNNSSTSLVGLHATPLKSLRATSTSKSASCAAAALLLSWLPLPIETAEGPE